MVRAEEQLDILERAKDSFRFHQRSNIDLLFKELSAVAVETGKPKPCSEMNIRAWLEKANTGCSSSSAGEHRHLLTRDNAEAEGAPVREDPKVKFSKEIKVIEIEARQSGK